MILRILKFKFFYLDLWIQYNIIKSDSQILRVFRREVIRRYSIVYDVFCYEVKFDFEL